MVFLFWVDERYACICSLSLSLSRFKPNVHFKLTHLYFTHFANVSLFVIIMIIITTTIIISRALNTYLVQTNEKYKYHVDYSFIGIDEWYKVTEVNAMKHIPNPW